MDAAMDDTLHEAPLQGRDITNGILLFVGSIVCTSLPTYYIAIKPNVLFLLVCLAFVLVNWRRVALSEKVLAILVASVLGAVISAFYWGDMTLALYPIYLWLSLILATAARHRDTKLFLRVATIFCIVNVVGAWIGFVSASAGLGPLYTFEGPAGRPAYLYLGTATNSVVGNFIRPSGLFDEPGTLSFVICMVVALRHVTFGASKIDAFLIAGGLVTQSLAHVVFGLVYLVAVGRKVGWVGLAVAFMALPLYFVDSVSMAFSERFFSRFEIVDGSLRGDSRTQITMNALANLDKDTILWGVYGQCSKIAGKCIEMYGGMGENPFTVLVFLGIFIAFPYYVIVFSIARRGFYRSQGHLISLGVVAILLQRPVVFAFGYSLLVILFFFNVGRARRLGSLDARSGGNRLSM